MLPSSRKRAAARSMLAALPPLDGGGHGRHAKRRQSTSPYVAQGNAVCAICDDKALQLVQLGACGHAVCRGCMTIHLLHALKLRQPLACPLPGCRARLRLPAALLLLEQQVPGSRALASQALLASPDPFALMDDACFACPHLDCQVPLELEDAQLPDVPSDCPACHRPLCGTCRSKWHCGLTCAQFQALAGAAGRSPHQTRDVCSLPTQVQAGTHCASLQHMQLLQRQQPPRINAPRSELLHAPLAQQLTPPPSFRRGCGSGACGMQEQAHNAISGVDEQEEVAAMMWSPVKGSMTRL